MTRDERLLMTGLRLQAKHRPHIRHALPPFLLYKPVWLIGAHPDSTPEERAWGAPVLDHLKAACHEPLLELSGRDRGNVERLLGELGKWAMCEASDRLERTAIWAALTVLYWLAEDDKYGLLVEGSHLHHAVYALLDAANQHEHLTSRYDRAARKGAQRLRDALERIELFEVSAL